MIVIAFAYCLGYHQAAFWKYWRLRLGRGLVRLVVDSGVIVDTAGCTLLLLCFMEVWYLEGPTEMA